MKALTIRQPWATLIALGVKTIETRSWRTNHRGPLAIHAGAASARPQILGDWCIDRSREGSWMRRSTLDPSTRLPLAAVVATATLADCVPIVGLDGCRQMADHHVCTSGDCVLEHWPIDGRRSDTEKEHGQQRPYGDYTPGRWAWLLTDVQPINPAPVKGRQGLWNWDGAA